MTKPVAVPDEQTRRGLHAVAEHVLAPALHQATGHIGLRVTPGGFGTPFFRHDGLERRIRVEGTDIVIDGTSGGRAPLTTVGEAAELAGIAPGAPTVVYTPTTRLEPDTRLQLDPAAVFTIHAWFDLAARALGRFRQAHHDREPTIIQLWPEHFDLALSMGAVTYGASPGDDQHAEPYGYVGPWNPTGFSGEFWNEPFGASQDHNRLRTDRDLLAFFETGHRYTSRSLHP
jgi:hypothetical protein